MSQIPTNHLYSLLEVSKDASMDDIKAAYRRLALKYHPDKNRGFENKLFPEIKSAYDVLSDPVQRNIYDNRDQNLNNIVDWKGFMKDVMSNMYVFFTMYIIPKNINIDVQVSLTEVYFKKVKKLEVRVKRWIDDKFSDSKISIYIHLNNYKKEYTFVGMGDDSILRNKQSSNIIVRLTINNFPEGVTIQDVFSEYDLYIIKDISLASFLLEEKLNILICQGASTTVINTGEKSYLLKDLGLPYQDESQEQKRGDVYVKLNVTLPDRNKMSLIPEARMFLLKYFN